MTADEPAEAAITDAAGSEADADTAAAAAPPADLDGSVESPERDPEYETVVSLVVEYETEVGPIRYTVADASIAVGSVGIFQRDGFGTSVPRVRRPGQSPRDAVSLEELWSEIHEQLPDGEILAFVDDGGIEAVVTRDGVWKLTGTKGFDGAPSRSMIMQIAPVRREYPAVPWAPGPMAADADRFYWIATSHTTTSKLFAVRRSGGTPRELWAGELLEQLATDGEFVYLCARDPVGERDPTACDLGWSRDTCGMRLVRLPVGGGEPETLAGRQATCEGLALHGDTVIWASGGSIYRMSKDGGDVERLVREMMWIWALQVHDGFVYWRSRGPTAELRRRRL
ncbi:MAG: hypothetical protein JXB32_11650 [Deltaproteobacteria bacterium]|nr:hypothetical protein [Deltaproteobacteria bacterium]